MLENLSGFLCCRCRREVNPVGLSPGCGIVGGTPDIGLHPHHPLVASGTEVQLRLDKTEHVPPTETARPGGTMLRHVPHASPSLPADAFQLRLEKTELVPPLAAQT